jgi:hypothetical protein
MTFKSIPIKYSVFYKDRNPMFGEKVSHVSLETEGAGGYIVIEQEDEDGKMHKISLDLEELDEIVAVAGKMVAAYDHAEKQG